MKFKIVSRGDKRSNKIKNMMRQYLESFGLEYHKEEPDLAISVGGDGTFLEAFHRYNHRLKETAFIGIHTGHLGFYTDWTQEEVDKLLTEIARTPFQTVEYPLMEVIIRDELGKKEDRHLALNEAMIKTADGSSVVLDVELKGEHFETFRGDGICISTPSGSTAYNKALGGAIIHPSLEAIQITENASINNRVFRTIGSPLVLPKHHTCFLKPMVDNSFLIQIDHFTKNYHEVKSIQCRVANEKIRFARFRQFPFWHRVRDSFVTEVD
ncbi:MULTISPECIES: NAD kinase [Oceanobacillus]|uniref:NAD kinase n=2 Tax=Oceanobacillus TaxID=182709 RepID=A0A0A1MGI9_9BACI|nr:NAD kinase [Oceanobacillus oncorhynchi]MDM8102459.1 NAD kinase [Oceanobacillus oncorhynchi]UUI38827.1 NAD kinase [Oceanobacillus oncorhynchi]CEI84535.1 putative inorganic polyphosphate/ATP-NAD kinase [Oceanobacillus oncorhynchi]